MKFTKTIKTSISHCGELLDNVLNERYVTNRCNTIMLCHLWAAPPLVIDLLFLVLLFLIVTTCLDKENIGNSTNWSCT